MPTKRKPLQHDRIGEIRVTKQMLAIYRAWQDKRRKDGPSIEEAKLWARLGAALGHMPWDDANVHDLHWHQLHLAAYPNPKKRPKRLGGVSWRNGLIDEYERQGTDRAGSRGAARSIDGHHSLEHRRPGSPQARAMRRPRS